MTKKKGNTMELFFSITIVEGKKKTEMRRRFTSPQETVEFLEAFIGFLSPKGRKTKK